MANRVECPFLVQDPVTGAVVNGATVTIKVRDSSTLASLYLSETGGSQSNPVSTVDGRIPAWVDPGSYDLTIVGSNFSATRTWDPVRGDAVTNIAPNAVGNTQLQPDAVGTTNIIDSAVTSSKLDAAVRPDQAFTTKKFLYRNALTYAGGGSTTVNGTYVIGSASNEQPTSIPVIVGSDSTAATGLLYIDTSILEVSGRVLNLYLNMTVYSGWYSGLSRGAIPTGATLTAGLYPLSGTTLGGSGKQFASNGIITLGSVVSGSTASLTAIAANSVNRVSSGAFVAPSPDFYALGLNVTGWASASGNYSVSCSLYYSTD